MITDRRVLAVIVPLRSHCSVCLDFEQHVKRSLIGQQYDHVANMNSESAKELLKLRNSVMVCRHGKRKGM